MPFRDVVCIKNMFLISHSAADAARLNSSADGCSSSRFFLHRSTKRVAKQTDGNWDPLSSMLQSHSDRMNPSFEAEMPLRCGHLKPCIRFYATV